MNNKFLNLLGLARVANSLVTGEEFVLEKLREKEVYLIILASDASDLTKKKINDKAKFYNCEVIDSYNTLELNQAIGLENRKVIGVTNQGFAKKMKEIR